MTKHIAAVPESITRQQYVALIEALGLNAYHLLALQFGVNSIYATVFARDADDQPYEDPLERNALAKHRISIPIVDEPEQP
jgi:hypothetical protein